MAYLDDLIPAPVQPGYLDDLIPGRRAAAPSDPQDPSRLDDLARSLKVGALKLPGQVAGLLDIPAALTSGDRPITKAADWIGEQTGFQPGKWAKDTRFSPQYEASRAAVGAAWKPVDQAVADPAASKADVVRALMDSLPDLAAKYAQNPMYSLNQAVESVPGMIAGGGLSRVLMTAGRAPGVAGGLERLAGTWAAPIAGGVGEGAMQAGQVMDEFKGDDQRRAAVAALASGGLDALIAGAGGRVANRLGLETPETLMAKIGDKSLAGATAKGAATAAAKLAGGAVGEGVLQEFPQSMQEQAWQNWAEGKPIGEGVLRAGVEGGITGAMMGAGSNVPGAARAVIPQREDKPAAAPPGAGAPPAIPAAEVLDEPKPTAAEKALEPRKLTDLDRVAEIDAELGKIEARQAELSNRDQYGPQFESERNDLAGRRFSLGMERDGLTKGWPSVQRGAPTSFSTEAGARVDGQYALIEASDLQASHDTDLRPNPAYPADLQPRDRTRAASEAQIASIVGRLDPARLGQSPTAADGAPIIGADGLVESGNARTIALQRVYRANGQKAENYKAWLREASAAVGLSPEQVDAMQQPVLVRVRTTPVNRAEFARQANASTVAAMSPVEQARADAARIDALDDLRPDDNGDFATSRDFIRRFVGRLPATEQPEMIDAGGQLSASGYARVRNAVLAKAYGDSPALTRMVESMDDNLRNVSRALMIAAPRVAQARAAIKAGRRFDADITPHLVGAVEELSRIKDAGGSVSDALAQTGLTGDERTPEARDLLAFLDENMRRPRRLAEFITAYFDALDAAGDPAQGSLMGEAEPPKTGELMAAVRRKQGENDAAATAATTARNAGGGQPGKVAPAAPGAAGGPAVAPGGGRGAQGDAAAPAANVAPTAANAPYRAYLLTPGDREKLLRLFPPTHDRVIADHLSAQALDAMHLVKDGPATGEVVGIFDHHGMQALVVSVNGAEKTATGSYFHLSWSVDEGVRTRNIGPAIAEYGFDRLAKPIKLDLSAGPNYIAPARDRSPGAERRDGESDKEFAKRVIDKRSAPITLPEKHSLYFNTGGAQTIDIADLVSTKTDEENAQGAENGAKRMAAAAAGELSKRGPITVMPSESQPGKYEVVDGNGTLSSVARYGWKSLPATVVTRAEGARMKALDAIAEAVKAAAKATLIDGRPYDIARDNFDRKVSLPALLVSKVESGIVKVANELSDRYHRVNPAPPITAEQRADAEAKLLPRMLRAAQAKAEFDGKLLSIVKETGAIGQMLAPIKAIGRAAEKLVVDEKGNVDGIKDLLRATIVVGHYDDAQAVVDAIRREFNVLRIKNRSMHEITGPLVKVEDREIYGGYSDVMVNVTMPNGTVAEIQVNVPVVMAAKGGAGHKLYEVWREQPEGSALESESDAAMHTFYDAAFDAAKARLDAAQLRKFASVIGAPDRGMPAGSRDSPSSDALKAEPSGKTTNSSPENEAMNLQPSGNLSGIFIGPSSTPSIVPASGENPKEEWRAFAPETGTLGVPRAEMPQVRAALRPELFEFLQGRGIGHQRVSLPADSLKPTQAEYSPAKTESAGHLAEEQTDRAAVLVSSDGYVLDGHHRWLARAEAHQPVWAIQFDAPIGKLLDAVMQFPGTHVSKDSEGAVTPSARDLAVQDFKDAMGDLGDFLTRHLRAAIVTEADKPKLMPTLVKAADAAIRIVGTDLRRVIAWMRDSFRKNKGTLPGWNTIPATWYREAAEKALAGLEERGQQTGLFSEKEQGDAAGAVLGSIGPAEIYGTRLSTAPAGARSSGMELPAVQAVADRVAKALPGLPPVKVLASPDDAPAPLRAFIASRNAAGDVEGALHDGTIYLFAGNLADEGRAEHVLAQHEAAHAGLRGLMDEAALQQSMRAIYATNAAVRRAARSMVDAGMSEAEATEEVLVDMPSAELAALNGWRAFVGRLRDGLLARGFTRLAELLDRWLAGSLTEQQRADLFAAELVRAARDYVRRPNMAADAGRQQRWLDSEARARGFKDIDDLAERAYPVFEKLAALWRKKHPASVLMSQRPSVERALSFDAASSTVIAAFRNDVPLKARPEYRAAKSGDREAAADLVQALVSQQNLQAARDAFGPGVVYVPVHAEEAAGRNQIPNMLAAYYAAKAGGTVDDDIVQSNRAFHTGASAMERLIARAEFNGKVEPGRRYVLVDDVTTMGSTLADLAAFIRAGGGEVAGSVVLVNAMRGGRMLADAKTVRELEARHGDEIRSQFGVAPGALTAEEARYLIGFRSTDELRGRVAAARQARVDRLGARALRPTRRADDDGLTRLSVAPKPPGDEAGQQGSLPGIPPAEVNGRGPAIFPPRQRRLDLPIEPGWSMPEGSRFDSFVYKMQDKLVDLKRAVGAIVKSGQQIEDRFDAYLQEELFHERAAKRTQDFVAQELAPLLEDMKANGVTQDALDAYLHARHAKEANKLIAERNPDIPDGGSGMTDAQADAYMAGLQPQQRADLGALAAKVDAIIAKTRDTYVGYGLESQDTVDGWARMFKHYVPLMREDHDGGMGIGQGFSIRGDEAKHRTGSTAKVVDILANVALQREKAIVRGEKNRVAVALAGLVKTNPNPDVWSFGILPKEQVFNPKTGQVEERIDPLFKSRPNALVAKIIGRDGKVHERAVIFNEKNERAMRMAAALKNLDAAALEGVLGLSAKITRYIAAVNTQYNPVFGAVNLVRDVQGALVNLTSTPLAAHRQAILKHTASALKGVYVDSRAARAGKAAASPWAALWEEFQNEGGATGFRDLYRTSADRAKAIERELDPHKWMQSPLGQVFTAGGSLKVPMAVAQDKAGWLFDWLSDYNQSMENAVRLAAYKVALEQGMTKQRAASLAKNLTVNFNRRGQAGMQAGALYAFFNASMQGMARMGEVMFDMRDGDLRTLRLSKVGKRIIAGGVLLGAMNALMLAAAGFDDEEPPEFVRERNLVIPIGGKKYIAIPLPLGWHVLHNLGRVPTEFMLGGFKEPAKHVIELVGVLADAFNPIGNAGLSMQTLAPTPLDPLVALTENRDWTGRPIAAPSFNEATPGFTRAKDTATAPARWIAEAINWISGGTQYKAGAWSPTPDQIDYLWGQATGGVGREAAKVEQTMRALWNGEELPPHKVPLVGRFFGNAEGASGQAGQFYTNLKVMDGHEAQLKGLGKAAAQARSVAESNELYAERESYTKEHPEAQLWARANVAQRRVRFLLDRKRELVKADAPRAEVKAVEDDITKAMREFNAEVRAAREPKPTAAPAPARSTAPPVAIAPPA